MKRKKSKRFNDILLELGTEPLPADSVYPLIKQLKDNTIALLKENNIIFGNVETFDTYRRLVVLIKEVKDTQEAPEYEIKGPSKEIAFDENNKPTKAYFGFLKKTGLKEIDINIRKTDQGQYLFGLKKEKAKKVKNIIAGILGQIIDSVKCDKYMRWGKNYEFIRPLRWILALFEDEKINLKKAGIVSDKFTFGHQILSSKKIKIKDISDYFKKLKKHYVILDFHKRRGRIEKGLNQLAGNRKAKVYWDRELLDELTNLTEYPSFLAGRFNKEYLRLPDEVIETSLKKGQKLFALLDNKNKVKNNFLAVIDNKPKKSVKKKITSHYENILDAKLKDSNFFLKQDTKTPLAERTNSLKELIFQKDLGSVYDKVERLKKLTSFISDKLNLDDNTRKKLKRCADLSKADLTTQMVQEFPNLQGFIGYKYALFSGEDKDIARGINEHYKPRSQDDDAPKSITGAVVGLADKLDTLCACFSIGLIPTGSHDPYALRRSALGLVRIILDSGFSISVDELIDEDLAYLENLNVKIDKKKTKEELKEFLKQRLKQTLAQSIKREDIIDAVLLADFSNFVDVTERIKQLDKISKSKQFFEAFKVIERTNNILKDAPCELVKVKPKLLKEDLEKKLYEIYNKRKDEISTLIKNKKYKQATIKYADYFFETLHLFFDKVMVNVDNKKLRNNRLSLMRVINRLYTEKVADLSVINF